MNKPQPKRDEPRNPPAQSRPEAGAPQPSHRSTPPYNPGLQKLVDGKQAWAVPLDAAAKAQGFRGWHQRGYLPHYDAPGVTQFVTIRLADSLPVSRRSEWAHLLRIENQLAGEPACSQLNHSKPGQSRSQTGAPARSADVSSAYCGQLPAMSGFKPERDASFDANAQSQPEAGAPQTLAGRERRRKLEEYLDRGLGECWLRQPAIAKLTEDALRFFDGQRYQLQAWVVMPNHVHLLVDVWETPLAKLIKSWKSFVAREANKQLGRGETFWEREYLDTLISGEKHRQIALRYIENNPVKAGLAREAKAWAWSSARFRDEYGRLKYTEA